ncbi:MAG: hypothetical protein FWC57_00025 [Endomicrobia bacterium]|nr:hypothetical protein [Endomicrobiia bacterium]
MGDYYGVFERNQPLCDFAANHSIPDNRLVGIVYNGNDFFVGAIVEDVSEAPDGAEFIKFPASEFLVTTHDFFETENDLMNSGYIGQTVGYAHSEEVQIPEGYERYTEYNRYMERWNFNYDENKFRLEVWFAIRKI